MFSKSYCIIIFFYNFLNFLNISMSFDLFLSYWYFISKYSLISFNIYLKFNQSMKTNNFKLEYTYFSFISIIFVIFVGKCLKFLISINFFVKNIVKFFFIFIWYYNMILIHEENVMKWRWVSKNNMKKKDTENIKYFDNLIIIFGFYFL